MFLTRTKYNELQGRIAALEIQYKYLTKKLHESENRENGESEIPDKKSSIAAEIMDEWLNGEKKK